MGKFARPLHAEITWQSRASERKMLRLTASISSPETSAKALIHDLSEKGVMFETLAKLVPGEIVLVDLPFIGSTEARIVWQKDSSVGCEFLTPVSEATISAALLQASVELTDTGIERTLEEVPVGFRPTLEDLTKWKVEFDSTRGANGYRLVGFRQTTDGVTIAMVTKTH